MVIVDSTVWIDWINDVENECTTWLEAHLALVEIGLIDLILCEVLQGTSSVSIFDNTLTLLTQYRLHQVSTADTIAAARNYQLLRTKGITVRKTIDCLIATFCIENNHTLLHHDRDFDHFEQHLDLQVVKV